MFKAGLHDLNSLSDLNDSMILNQLYLSTSMQGEVDYYVLIEQHFLNLPTIDINENVGLRKFLQLYW